MEAPGAEKTYSPETLSQVGFPTISYGILEVGAEFRSDDQLVRPEDVATYAYAIEDYDPWFFAPGPFGDPIAHPTFLAKNVNLGWEVGSDDT